MPFDWKAVLRTVAPGLATALGGPLAGLAISALSTALLGRPDGSEQDVAAAIGGAGPDLLLRMKQADLDFQTKLKEVDLKLEEIAANDRDSARRREQAVRDRMPAILALLVTLGFFGMLAFMAISDIPGANRDLLTVMLGALGAAWTSVVGYFFGSSAGSAEKTRLLGSSPGRG